MRPKPNVLISFFGLLGACFTKMLDMEIVLDQQDLAGFFNNVEHHRILTSVQFLIHQYVQLQDVSIDSDFSVATQHAERVQRVFKGRWRRPGSTVRVLQLRDVVPLVGVLLQYSLFTVGGTVFQQTCGASMGSQWAPVLCSIVAVFREWSFVQSLQASSTWIQHALLARYVDNRILLLVNTPKRGPDLNILCWPWFYGRPLELEVVQDDIVLGFRIDPLQRSITLRLPVTPHALRSFRSAGAQTAILSGLRARLFLVCRYVRPRRLILHQAQDLVWMYATQGIPFASLLPIARDMLQRFHLWTSEARDILVAPVVSSTVSP